MRSLLTSALLSLAVSAGVSLTAHAAPGGESGERTIKVWSDGPGGIQINERAESPRQRLAYATPRETYDEDEVRPRRRSYDAEDGERRPRYTKPRTNRSAKQHRRHRNVAKKPGVSRQAAVQKAPRQSTDKPAWSKRSLSRSGPVGSGHTGVASFYWQPQRVASGGWFNPSAMTAAHKTLPFGTRVRVTHLGNGRSVEVKINDRGPYVAGRIIDLSRAAAGVIGMTAQGVARVAVEILGK